MTPERTHDIAISAARYGLFQFPAGWFDWGLESRLAHCLRWYAEAKPKLAASPEFLYAHPQYREDIAAPAPAPPPTFPAIETRNLIYHVAAIQENDAWAANVRQLAKRWEVFNGRRVVAISSGPITHSPAIVRGFFQELGLECEFMELPNDAWLRETLTFLPLLASVASADPAAATFYGHTKGNSTAENRLGATYWRNAAYLHLLGGWQRCMDELRAAPAVGIHKMRWGRQVSPYPSGLRHGEWMFAGTFFWFRNDAVFSNHRWRVVPADRYGAESWLSGLFAASEVVSVYQLWDEGVYPTPNPYDPATYPEAYPDD